MSDQSPDLWDAEAAGYDEPADHGLRDASVRDAWRSLLLEHLPAAPARVADLGCGTGTLGLLLAEEGYAVDGVDFSPAMLAQARAKAGRVVTFHEGDAGDPPLDRAAYDVVLCRHVLWALPDPAVALARWIDLLGPDGRLVLVEGFWGTGAGLRATETAALVRSAGRDPRVVGLSDRTELWGGPPGDERYLVVG
ncbi:class I SAM-dependent methyltransferase [Nocardioides litoris]|uniref:class I SAM-dependent methyltransferase n=1 Tax=Nocardioides litoris TaxID=1926648 RepID=UPI0011224B1A|nr:class I SAM-dependent methyltransferase [Nocardioides litoris]